MYVLILNELSQSLPPKNNEKVLLQFLKVRDFFLIIYIHLICFWLGGILVPKPEIKPVAPCNGRMDSEPLDHQGSP